MSQAEMFSIELGPCCARSRKRSSMPRFSLAEVWKCLAPTVRAYLREREREGMEGFAALDETCAEQYNNSTLAETSQFVV